MSLALKTDLNLQNSFRLFRDGAVLKFDNGKSADKPEVKVLYLRPLSGMGKDISIYGIKEKMELAYISSLDKLQGDSKKLVMEALAERYLIFTITKIINSIVRFGQRIVEVETDRGRRKFNIKDINHDVTWLDEDHLVIKDSFGNRFEIRSFSELDAMSKKLLEKTI